jgi:hypothetical protein
MFHTMSTHIAPAPTACSWSRLSSGTLASRALFPFQGLGPLGIGGWMGSEGEWRRLAVEHGGGDRGSKSQPSVRCYPPPLPPYALRIR